MTYNKDEVMQALREIATLIKDIQYERCHQKQVGLSTAKQDVALDNLGSQFNNLLSTALDSAYAAGREETKTKIFERDKKMFHYYQSVFVDGYEGGYPVEWDNI